MQKRKYLIGSSYFENGKGGSEFRREFCRIWSENTIAASPSATVIICEGGSSRPICGYGEKIITLSGDLGHCHHILNGIKKNEFSGWSASMVALAMIAYCDESDFIYKEEDCLAFGPWVERMYHDIGDGKMVFGNAHKGPPWMSCSQSLFLVKHDFIPSMVSSYLALGGERSKTNLGEDKFVKIESKYGTGTIKRLSFGVDRERPIPYDNDVWYAQQITREELSEMKKRGLVK